MTRELATNLLVLALLVALTVWIAMNTYWEDTTVPIPPRGEAADNPYYGVEKLAAVLGVHTREVTTLPPLPPPGATLVVGLGLQPALSKENLPVIEHWVEAGGRLAVSAESLRGNEDLQSWSGITSLVRRVAPNKSGDVNNNVPRATMQVFPAPAPCRDLDVAADGTPAGATMQVCGIWLGAGFASRKTPTWSAGDADGLYSLRIPMGNGSVSLIAPATIYDPRTLLKGDHARIFFKVTDLAHGDALWLYRPMHAEPLPVLLWRLAAPAILFCACAIALWIWRNLPRFGPPAPTPVVARRSLAEQLRANAAFSWRTRRLGALYAAARRGVEETARREIVAYERMPSAARLGAIAERSGIPGDTLRSALAGAPEGNADAQCEAITVLEQARRLLKPRITPEAKV